MLGEQVLRQSGLYHCHLTTAGLTPWPNYTDQDIREREYFLGAFRSMDHNSRHSHRPLLWPQSWTAIYLCLLPWKAIDLPVFVLVIFQNFLDVFSLSITNAFSFVLLLYVGRLEEELKLPAGTSCLQSGFQAEWCKDRRQLLQSPPQAEGETGSHRLCLCTWPSQGLSCCCVPSWGDEFSVWLPEKAGLW